MGQAKRNGTFEVFGLGKEAVIQEAQRLANQTGKKWVWWSEDGLTHRAKVANILSHVELEDVVLEGEIVVLERPRQKEVYHLLWPELPQPSCSANPDA